MSTILSCGTALTECSNYLTFRVDRNGSVAYDINDAGQVVGMDHIHGAWIWDSTNGVQDLNNLMVPHSNGWSLSKATAINNLGQIVGYGVNPDGNQHTFLLTIVPKPISSILFVTGGTLLAGRRYLKSAKERKCRRTEGENKV